MMKPVLPSLPASLPQGERGDRQHPSPLAGEGLRERGGCFTLMLFAKNSKLAATQLKYIRPGSVNQRVEKSKKRKGDVTVVCFE